MLIMKYFTPSAIAFVLLATSLQAYSAVIPSQPQVPADGPPPARAPQVPKSQSDGKPLQEGALGHHVSRELGSPTTPAVMSTAAPKNRSSGVGTWMVTSVRNIWGAETYTSRVETLGKRTDTSVETQTKLVAETQSQIWTKKKVEPIRALAVPPVQRNRASYPPPPIHLALEITTFHNLISVRHSSSTQRRKH
ncbi:hypothetical protein BDP27DRAFT_1402304 [Rhodocollybia butyracea]|uniref:Uncharacterized protein n=1 Tax=Rhodocollybia butyracea TaxID=206335 RepID=A0A9P5U8I5_9AGAR|nr:hypothetical protein BDP27DRAFT_1402304 [Rhodocollybia butyracea]